MKSYKKMSYWQRLRVLFNLPRSGRLIWGLLRDYRVPVQNKIMFLGLAVGYFLLPMDLVPDLLPFIGQFDDITVMLFLVDRFVASIPGYVVSDHLESLR